MNSITTEEVERLMRVVSEPLRIQWEAKNNNGESLVGLQKARSEAVSYIESSYKNIHLSLLWLLINVMLLSIGVIILNQRILSTEISRLVTLVVLVAFMVPACVYYSKKLGRLNASKGVLESCNKVFMHFKKSVHALNPHGIGNTYHDVITAEYAFERLKSLALRVIDAQVSFDVTRKDEHASRYQIIHLGNFVEKAEETFDRSLDFATNDFSLQFDKGDIYREAQAEYDKRRAAAATH